MKYGCFWHYELPSKANRISITKIKAASQNKGCPYLIFKTSGNFHQYIIVVIRWPERGLQRAFCCWPATMQFPAWLDPLTRLCFGTGILGGKSNGKGTEFFLFQFLSWQSREKYMHHKALILRKNPCAKRLLRKNKSSSYMLHEIDRDTHFLTKKASVTLTISFFFPIYRKNIAFLSLHIWVTILWKTVESHYQFCTTC